MDGDWIDWRIWLSAIVFLTILTPYLVGPFIIFLTFRLRFPTTIVEVDPRNTPLPPDARDYFHKAHEALAADGFVLAGVMGLPDLTPNAQTLFALYANRETFDLAMSAIIVAKNELGGELRTSYVEFHRRYDDGVVVQTNNSKELSAFKALPNEFTTRLPKVSDIRRLFLLHVLLCEKLRQRGRPVLRLDSEFGGDALRYIAESVLDETFRNQVGAGYLAKTAEGYRPTVFGALIMTWQELWPCKAIRRSLQLKRADALIAELKRERMAAK